MQRAAHSGKVDRWPIIGCLKPFAPHAFLFSIISLLMAIGAFEPIDNALMEMRFRLLQRAPSDTLVIVEIDPRSLKEEARWPWPRDRYGTVIENLQNAGAVLIGFDIDISSLSDKTGDTALVSALSKRPGDVILPVFAQPTLDMAGKPVMAHTPPHNIFLTDSVIASVNLMTDKNGIVRHGWRGILDNGAYRTSLAAMLAGKGGAQQGSFYIDYGIDITKVRRLSFHDVLNNDFPKDLVAGKNILIGATAVELGDEFVAPVYGVTPGVMLHALSYESLVQGRTLLRSHSVIVWALSLLVILCFCRSGRDRRWRAATALNWTVLISLVSGPILLQWAAPISFDVAAMLGAQLLCVIYVSSVELRARAYHLIRHRIENARYQALTSLVVRDNSDGVIVVEKNGVIELCNDRAKELLGLTGDPLGARLLEIAPGFPADRQLFVSDISSKQAPVFPEYRPKASDDLVLEVVASSSVYNAQTAEKESATSGGRICVYTLRDISARKRIEQAERDAKESAIAADKLKTQLISNMSHELRTPLNAVIGFADILQKESFGPLGVNEYKEYSENIYLGGKRLLNVVNDILNIAKLDAGEIKLNRDAMPLVEVVECCVDKFENILSSDEKSLSIEIAEGLPDVNIDFMIFQEMLSHLVSNAIKFTDKKGRIVIRAAQNGCDLTLAVSDNGCGVDPSLLPKLTEVFSQGNAEFSRGHEGAGMGLYIVEKFAALHGGEISFRSKPGLGFIATLRFENMVAAKAEDAA